MTFIEFAETVLGMELLDWQKVVLEHAQKCKDEGKDFYITTYAGQGKEFLNNAYLQKLGYDRGYNKALDDAADIYNSNPDISVYNLIRQLKMPKEREENKDKSTIIIDEWIQSPSQPLKKEVDKFVDVLEKTSSIGLPEKEVKE